MNQLEVRSRAEWRRWLERNHSRSSGVWLVFQKRTSGKASISYEDSLEEALCFGWIDSLVKRLDESRYLRKFTPRKPDSMWSSANRRRYESLAARGLLAPPGLARAPTTRSGDAPRRSSAAVPTYIRAGLQTDTRAWSFFQQLAPSYRRTYITWIESAKRPETRARRLAEVIQRLVAGEKPGLK